MTEVVNPTVYPHRTDSSVFMECPDIQNKDIEISKKSKKKNTRRRNNLSNYYSGWLIEVGKGEEQNPAKFCVIGRSNLLSYKNVSRILRSIDDFDSSESRSLLFDLAQATISPERSMIFFDNIEEAFISDSNVLEVINLDKVTPVGLSSRTFNLNSENCSRCFLVEHPRSANEWVERIEIAKKKISEVEIEEINCQQAFLIKKAKLEARDENRKVRKKARRLFMEVESKRRPKSNGPMHKDDKLDTGKNTDLYIDRNGKVRKNNFMNKFINIFKPPTDEENISEDTIEETHDKEFMKDKIDTIENVSKEKTSDDPGSYNTSSKPQTEISEKNEGDTKSSEPAYHLTSVKVENNPLRNRHSYILDSKSGDEIPYSAISSKINIEDKKSLRRTASVKNIESVSTLDTRFEEPADEKSVDPEVKPVKKEYDVSFDTSVPEIEPGFCAPDKSDSDLQSESAIDSILNEECYTTVKGPIDKNHTDSGDYETSRQRANKTLNFFSSAKYKTHKLGLRTKKDSSNSSNTKISSTQITKKTHGIFENIFYRKKHKKTTEPEDQDSKKRNSSKNGIPKYALRINRNRRSETISGSSNPTNDATQSNLPVLRRSNGFSVLTDIIFSRASYRSKAGKTPAKTPKPKKVSKTKKLPRTNSTENQKTLKNKANGRKISGTSESEDNPNAEKSKHTSVSLVKRDSTNGLNIYGPHTSSSYLRSILLSFMLKEPRKSKSRPKTEIPENLHSSKEHPNDKCPDIQEPILEVTALG